MNGVASGVDAAFDIVRPIGARRVRLALDPTTGRARLVVPRRAKLASAVAWAEGKAEWLAVQRARLPAARPFVDGASIPLGDDVLTVRWREGRSRIVTRDGNALMLSGPVETVARRVESWLRREALAVLDRETREIAAAAQIAIATVAIGDPRGRWGSCAHDGRIRYSWRLILAPAFVRRATVAHEVAHRLHMNHSPAFHAAAARLLGDDPAPAREWLRRHGAALHWYGRSS